MHLGGHTFLGDLAILYKNTSDTGHFPHDDGEFDGLHDFGFDKTNLNIQTVRRSALALQCQR